MCPITFEELLSSGVCSEKKEGIDLLAFEADSHMTPDERILRKYGIKDEKGEFTAIALELVLQKLVREHQTWLLDLILDKEKSDEEKKA